MLVRIVTCRMMLRRVIGSNPEVFGGEVSTLEHAGLRMCKGQDVFTRHQFVADRFADAIENGRIGDLPIATGQRINYPLRLRLRREEGCSGEVSVAVRIFGT